MESIHQLSSGFERTSKLESPLVKLHAPRLGKEWGAPRLSQGVQGGYEVSYKNPARAFERLVIYVYPKAPSNPASPPAEVSTEMVNDQLADVRKPQNWKAVTIDPGTGPREIRWFVSSSGGGADGSYYSTEVFPIEQDGRTSHVRLVIESVSDAAPARFREVRIQP